MPADIALVTERRYENPTDVSGYVANILEEDRLLSAALQERGWSTQRVDWSREDVDWSAYRGVVLRTTWDYFERFEAFEAWLDRLQGHGGVLNPLPTIRWNLDKHYLGELAAAGVPTIATQFVERGSDRSLASVIAAQGWDEVVTKPAVSGAARQTYRVRADQVQAHEAGFAELVEHEAMLVQPFMPGIVAHGEVTVVVMNGRPTHAVCKRAKAGDFRVQDDHGGTVHAHVATEAQLKVAAQAVEACAATPVYGRVDMVTGPDGVPQVMELELIEPELWLRFEPSAAAAFADAIVERLTPPAQSFPPG